MTLNNNSPTDNLIRYRIRQNGKTIVTADDEQAIWHYAMQYRKDGEVTIQHNAEGHWKRLALLVQWGGRDADQQ